ncbi:hypothetical protein QQP08_012187 [Theobroma cacao]|nr:hypothetical protein QQP08_012187 [Theobroma cacao]
MKVLVALSLALLLLLSTEQADGRRLAVGNGQNNCRHLTEEASPADSEPEGNPTYNSYGRAPDSSTGENHRYYPCDKNPNGR